MTDLDDQDNLPAVEGPAADLLSRRIRSGIRANKHWPLTGMAGTNLGHTTILARMTVREFCNISVVGTHATVDKEESEFKGQFVAQRELTPAHAKGLALYILRGLVIAGIARRRENNRPVTVRIREIANDLAGGPYQGLQPFTANIRDWTESDYNQLVAVDKEFALYKILLPVLIKLWVVDGQHRRHALNLVLRYLEQLLKDNAYPRAKSHNLYFSDEAGTNGAIDAETLEFWQEVYDILIEEHSITMEVHLGLNEEQEKQLFVDLNSRGKKLSASMLGEYDRSDAIAVLSAKLRDDNVITVPIFSDSDAKNWETAGLTFSDIVMVNRLLIHGANSKAPTPQALVNDKLEFVERFWTTVHAVPGFVDVDARSKTVVAQPVMLKALAKLAFDLGYGKASLQDDEALKKLFLAMLRESDLFSHDKAIWRALFLNDADRAGQFGAPINQFVYVNNQLVGKTGNVDEDGKVRFGHAHNDIYPRLGDILRWHLGLDNRGAANKAREKEGRPQWGPDGELAEKVPAVDQAAE
jgi:hypothetical protein